VGQKGGVSDRWQPGSVVVSHVVAVSWDERHLVAAEVALVFCLDLAAKAAGPLVVVARVQDSVGVLSVRLATVTSRKSRSRFMTSSCPIPPACSRSLLLTGPWGFERD
jgi:hypothetical protein